MKKIRVSYLVFLVIGSFFVSFVVAQSPQDWQNPQWYKGNLHTHSLWSDGSEFPEVIASWYKNHGYHFLALSDHNTLSEKQRWLTVGKERRMAHPDNMWHTTVDQETFDRYLKCYGPQWVRTRQEGSTQLVQLKPLAEFRFLLEEAGRFLMIQSEEITAKKIKGTHQYEIHVNATNIKELIHPQPGHDIVRVIQKNIDAIIQQRLFTGQAILPHLNHPNMRWSITAEHLLAVKGLKFFEVYNGIPDTNTLGDTQHASTERIWDIILTVGLALGDRGVIYGLAVDDAHRYGKSVSKSMDAGRGWIVVRSAHLTPNSIILAMEKGNFYASTGVELVDINYEKNKLSIMIREQPGVHYNTQFIGSYINCDLSSKLVFNKERSPLQATRNYNEQLGRILKETKRNPAVYHLTGDELYVRAKVISSSIKDNPSHPHEFEVAWIQPVVPQ